MNKTEFLETLHRGLYERGVPDAPEILEEYRQHFARKLADGYSEEETASRLGSPEELAAQFPAPYNQDGAPVQPVKNSSAGFARVGVVFASIGVYILLILFAAWTLVLAAAAVSFAVIGASLPMGYLPLVWYFLPKIPFIPMLLFIAALGFAAILTALAAFNCAVFVFRFAASFRRFCRNAVNRHVRLPSVTVFPLFSSRLGRTLRLVTVIALFAFVVTAAAAYAVSAVTAGSLEFWHVWRWFM